MTLRSRLQSIGRRLTRHKALHVAMRESEERGDLRRSLGKLDLYSIGIGSSIGAGIFVLTGVAAKTYAGPAVIISYLFSGLSIVFSALCYAELAARVPISGSAYAYAVVTLGELPALLIGWNLTLEYTISAAAVSRGFAAYLVSFLEAVGASVPTWLYDDEIAMAGALDINFSPLALMTGLLIGAIAVFGGKTGSTVNVVVCVLTLAIVIFCIIAGFVFAEPANWSDFAPFGQSGVFKAAAVLFFAYVGFDAVACSAEEAANPKVDVPFGMLASLGTVTVLYTLVATALTLMVNYQLIDTDAPLSEAFAQHGADWAQIVVAVGSLSALFTTVLTSYVAQSRIFFAMARDGLLPARLATVVGPRKVPIFSVIFVVLFSSVVGALVELESLSEMVSIGTLMALSFVCASVLILRYDAGTGSRKPFFLTMAIVAVAGVAAACIRFDQVIAGGVIYGIAALLVIPFFFMPKSPMELAFKTPLVPVVPAVGLGLNLFLMSSLSDDTWWRLFGWTIIGLLVYFLYSIRFSKLSYGEPSENNLQDSEVREGLEVALTQMDVVALDDDEHQPVALESHSPSDSKRKLPPAADEVKLDDPHAEDKERLEASLARTKLKNKRKTGDDEDEDDDED
jgi:APA family basic amino acid/polyamine antiporter